ncbi:PIN domain-containing protein [Fimbriimonas ginsengisoli]|uniref:PilT-like protein n=1 Tax=Fimbriimonas ginsengisoli Gsoil 348 TaxID=661478 RepID=A0A068NKZ1_FIMGI|nr:PIN domain-containing protein [Fimbriimonas ginsengisoli]AIE84258.1 PilT-like protein [Fimbriimonas ginsengisoli Gsoil 348]
MSGADPFLDTNVFVYIHDDRAPAKQDRAVDLVQTCLDLGTGSTSYQVVQEFLNVATRKFSKPMSEERAAEFMRLYLMPLCRVFLDAELFEEALRLRSRYEFSFYDALVVSSAVRAGCTVLLTEDLPSGQVVEGLRIENPFRGL